VTEYVVAFAAAGVFVLDGIALGIAIGVLLERVSTRAANRFFAWLGKPRHVFRGQR